MQRKWNQFEYLSWTEKNGIEGAAAMQAQVKFEKWYSDLFSIRIYINALWIDSTLCIYQLVFSLFRSFSLIYPLKLYTLQYLWQAFEPAA